MCERNIDRLPAAADLACNPGMCPDWESNQQSLGLQDSTQSTEPQQPSPHLDEFFLITEEKKKKRLKDGIRVSYFEC